MTIGKLFRRWRKRQVYKQLLELDDQLLDDLGYQRNQLVKASDTQLYRDRSRLLALRPGASCCSVASRDVSLDVYE